MAESIKLEFDGKELYNIAGSLLTSININKRHLEVWKGYEREPDKHFKPNEIESGIELYTRLVNEDIAIRHKVLKALKKDPHPEFI